ncbi:MAG TPA: ion channel [Steroidobacteraceae bacterium]|nr:ion channel [Steroidobacteraceae bacterium]
MNEHVQRLSALATAGTLAAMPAADSAPGSALPAGPTSPGAEAAAGARRRLRYGLLLLAITASFSLEGIASEGAAAQSLVTTLLGVTLLLAFWAGDMPVRRLRQAAIPVAALVVAVDVALIAGQGQTVTGITRLASGVLVAFAPPAIVVGVLRTLRRQRAVTVDVVFGALCLYLLAGMFFAFAYGAVNNLGGSPFFDQGLATTPSRCLYFSFTTLTTVGYGDLTAHSNLGHTLAVMEALVGQIYLVTVVATIVGNVGSRSRPAA